VQGFISFEEEATAISCIKDGYVRNGRLSLWITPIFGLLSAFQDGSPKSYPLSSACPYRTIGNWEAHSQLRWGSMAVCNNSHQHQAARASNQKQQSGLYLPNFTNCLDHVQDVASIIPTISKDHKKSSKVLSNPKSTEKLSEPGSTTSIVEKKPEKVDSKTEEMEFLVHPRDEMRENTIPEYPEGGLADFSEEDKKKILKSLRRCLKFHRCLPFTKRYPKLSKKRHNWINAQPEKLNNYRINNGSRSKNNLAKC
jgi:hypothetical protein